MSNENEIVLGKKFGDGQSSPPKISCEKAQEIARAVVDGKKRSPEEVAHAAGHFMTCPKCGRS